MEKPERSLIVKLTRTRFAELIETLGQDVAKAKLSHMKGDELYQQFDYVMVDNEDRFYGLKDEKETFLFKANGAWQQVLEYNL